MKAPFCLVPSGSGNALAANCGLWTPEAAALALCRGRTRALDIFSVVQPPSRRYFAFLSIYYGMMANLDHGTDHLRCAASSLWPATHDEEARPLPILRCDGQRGP